MKPRDEPSIGQRLIAECEWAVWCVGLEWKCSADLVEDIVEVDAVVARATVHVLAHALEDRLWKPHATVEGKMSGTRLRSSMAVWPAWAKRRLVSDESRRLLLTMGAMMEMKSREDEDDYSSR